MSVRPWWEWTWCPSKKGAFEETIYDCLLWGSPYWWSFIHNTCMHAGDVKVALTFLYHFLAGFLCSFWLSLALSICLLLLCMSDILWPELCGLILDWADVCGQTGQGVALEITLWSSLPIRKHVHHCLSLPCFPPFRFSAAATFISTWWLTTLSLGIHWCSALLTFLSGATIAKPMSTTRWVL